jgi:DNA uptake protein ComE-like DNA-binding protein
MRVLTWLGVVGLGIFTGAWLFRYSQRKFAGGEFLNINEATQEEIIVVLGLDAAIAERIVEHRPYPSKIDLLGRMIVPDDVYNSIRHRITHRAS